MADSLIEKFIAPGKTTEPAATTTEPTTPVVPAEPVTPQTTPEGGTEPTGEPAEQATPATGEPGAEPTGEPTELPDYLKKVIEVAGEGYQFGSEEEFKAFFEKYKKDSGELETLRGQNDFVTEVEKWIEEEGAKYDPKSVIENRFGEGSYSKVVVANEIAKALGGNFDRAYQMVNGGINKMSDMDIMIEYAQFRAPGVSKKDAQEVILEGLGVNLEDVDDIDNVSLSSRQKTKLAMDASEVKNTLNKAIESVKVEDPVNPIRTLKEQFDARKAKSEEVKGQWEEARTSLLSSFGKIQVDKDFDFEINSEEGQKIIDDFISQASKKGLEPNDANKQMVIKQAKKYFADKNRAKINAAFRAKIEADITAKIKKERNNQAPLTTPAPAPEPGDTEAQSQWKKSLGLAGRK